MTQLQTGMTASSLATEHLRFHGIDEHTSRTLQALNEIILSLLPSGLPSGASAPWPLWPIPQSASTIRMSLVVSGAPPGSNKGPADDRDGDRGEDGGDRAVDEAD